MGNNCTNFNITQLCTDDDNTNIKILGNDIEDEAEEENKNENNNNNSIKKDEDGGEVEGEEQKEKEEDVFSISQIVSVSNKKISPLKNTLSKENNLSAAQQNLISNIDKCKVIKKTITAGFTNFMQDNSDFSFNNGNNIDKNDVFETNYIIMKDDYNEQMNDYLNKIRNDPFSVIDDINELLKEENIDENQKIQIENEETHENIIFNDEGNAIRDTKNFLSKVKALKTKFHLNDDLLIDTTELEKNSELNLNKKITKILVEKRKRIISTYPQCQFFVNFIKDAKINLLYLLSENEEKSNFRKIIFNPIYTQFNVTWNIEKKNNFISFLCFA